MLGAIHELALSNRSLVFQENGRFSHCSPEASLYPEGASVGGGSVCRTMADGRSMRARGIWRWTLGKWLVFWSVLVVVLLISFLVQAQEPLGEEGDGRGWEDSVKVEVASWRQWLPFFEQEGIATWYGPGFHGRRSASGKRFNMYELTAAHRWLPFGTLVRVYVPGRDTAMVVQIMDRGPFVRRRVIDLSWAAARMLGIRLHPVRLEAYLPPRDQRYLLGFGDGWKPYIVEREAVLSMDTVYTWTEAVRQWERRRKELPGVWIFASWSSGQDSAESRQPYALYFCIGIPRRLGTDSLLSHRS